MPKQDPAAWREAREMWETSEMTYSDVAARLDVAIPTVTLRAKRECWVKADVVDLQRASYTPKQLVEVALRALVRAASQTKDHGAAVKAANSILERVMGRVVAEAPPMLKPEALPAPEGAPAALPGPEQDWPDWMEARRLAYQLAQQQPQLEESLGKSPPP